MIASRARRGPAIATAILLVLASACARDRETSSPGAEASAVPRSPEVSASVFAVPSASPYGLGRPATADEIRAWDVGVSPDGRGLPPGRGSVAEGEKIYAAQCIACHGPEGEGGPYDRLASRAPVEGFPFGTEPALLSRRTIGNYWPYATTLYDYIHRAMPQAVPGSLQPSEVYALVAYVLYLNRIVPAGAVMDAQALPRVRMPAHDRFVRDDRRGGAEVR